MRARIVGSLVVAALVVGGCHRAHYTPYSNTAYQPTQSVAVLHSMPTDRHFVELGELSIRVGLSNSDSWVQSLCQQAQAIGADAIVLLGDRSPGTVAVPVGSVTVARSLRDGVVVAIRFTD